MNSNPARKIGILNFPGHWNQGANLTSYALQQFLISKGHDVENVHLCMNYKLLKKPIYTDFSDKYIRMTDRRAYGDGDMQQFNDEFDTFITGSDQVWRYEQSEVFTWKKKFISSFFLGFARPGKRRVSMAASFGTAFFDAPPAIKQMAQEELARYTAISVREESGYQIVKSLSKQEATILVDPVFYLPREHWNKLCEKSSAPKCRNLINYNSFFVHEWVERFLKKYPDMPHGDLLSQDTLGWMRHIRDARFVITDSFHVTCYCLIFGTPFACLCSEQWGIARLYGLSENFSFAPERIIDVEKCTDVSKAIEELMGQEINWQPVWARMDAHREQASTWLDAALCAPIPAWSGPAYKEASPKECQDQRLQNIQWQTRRMFEKKIHLCHLLLKVSPFMRAKLKSKLASLESHYYNLSW